MELLLFNEVLKNLIFFQLPIKTFVNIEQISNSKCYPTGPNQSISQMLCHKNSPSQDFNRKILTKSLGKQRCNCGRDHHHFPSTHDLLFLRSLTILYSRPETWESFIGLLNDAQLDRTCKIQYTVKSRVLTCLV